MLSFYVAKYIATSYLSFIINSKQFKTGTQVSTMTIMIQN